MSDLALTYLRRDPQVVAVSYAATTTQTQVLPRDPQRYALQLPSDTVNPIFYWLGASWAAYSFMMIPAKFPPLLLTEDDLGGYVTESLWVYSSAACPPWTFVSLRYNNAEFETLRRIQHEYISKLESS